MAVGFDTSAITGFLWKQLGNLWFWLLVILMFSGGAIAVLIWVRKHKLTYTSFEWVFLGNGKTDIITHKAGWFKQKKMFFNLIELSGPIQMEQDDGRPILDASTEDYNFVNGRKAIHVMRNQSNPTKLVPFNKFEISNQELIASIAPSTYADTAAKFMEDKRLETVPEIQKWAGPIAMGIILIVLIIGLVMVIQFSNARMDKVMDWQCAKTGGGQSVSQAP